MLRIDDEFLHHHQFLLLLIVTLFSLYFLTKRLYNNPPRRSNQRLPPSPPKLPILGNLHQLSALAHRSFHSLGTKYGPLMLLHFGSKPVIIVQSADAAREIMKTNDLIFADKPSSRTTRRLFYDLKDLFIAPYGEYWRKLRSICVLQLLSSRRVQSFGFIREEETAILMKKIESCLGSPLNLTELFATFTNDVICRAAFGRKYSEWESGRKFPMLLRKVLELMGSFSIGQFIPWLSWISYVNGFNKRVDEVAKEVDDFLELVVQERLNHQGLKSGDKDEGRESFVDILLNVYKDNQTAGVSSIDRDSIKAIILDIFAGGTDTTSATLEWAMSELLRHQLIFKNVQTEVREIMREKQGITENDLSKMSYLKAVVKETLRLHPPAPYLGREPRENVEVMGYDIAAGTMILINTWAIGRDPVYWDEPERFLPERFLSCSIDLQGQDFGLIPFGAGRRGCPGIGFAMGTVELVLANLAHKFEWGLPECGYLDMIEKPGAATHRKNHLFAVATPCYF